MLKYYIRKNSLTRIPKKTYLEMQLKTIKWYWREINYDMLINGKFKNRYLINQKENENLEFIPIDIHGNKINYNSCLIFIEIYRLININIEPTKVNMMTTFLNCSSLIFPTILMPLKNPNARVGTSTAST